MYGKRSQISGYQQIPTQSGIHDIEMPASDIHYSEKSWKATTKFVAISALVFIAVLATTSFSSPSNTSNLNPVSPTTPHAYSGADNGKKQVYQTALFDTNGRYIFRDYDEMKPMSNFLAGLGGYWGVPMWAFYVNRGQGITSFGVQNKDGGIAKFLTAEKAYQQTPFTGFRTFIKGEKGGKEFNHQPFFPIKEQGIEKPTRNMMIGMNEMEIEEVSPSHSLKTNVLYFTPPDEDFPSLVRSTTFTNLDSTDTLQLDVLDGLGKLIPSGLPNWNLDAMGRTMEAWMNVYNIANGDFSAPFYHISQGTADTASVQIIKDGHFAVSFVEGRDLTSEGLNQPLQFIVDPSVVYGVDTTLTNPSGYFERTSDLDTFMKSTQGTTSRTPCAFAGTQISLPPGGSATVTTIYGHASSVEEYLGKILPKLRASGYAAKKRVAARALVADITERVSTTTSSPILDLYIKQDYLDNVLRGGLPVPLGDPSKPKIYHTFSRIHGDIERDYNNYQIDVTYYSQGPGNFRDVNQNRRLDVMLSPVVGDFNVRMFLSFVQADGYNPLTVASTNFKVPTDKIASLVASIGISTEGNIGKMTALLSKPFRVGQLFSDMKAQGVTFSIDRADLLSKVISAADQSFAGQYAQNGFWADHWTYTLDLVENYVSVFPDKESSLLWDSDPVPFFMSPSIVKSRTDRYSLVDNPNAHGTSTIRVYNAVAAIGEPGFPPERKVAMEAIWSDSSYVADQGGAGGSWQRDKSGKVFSVSIIAKLLMLGSLKFSTLDPQGMGVEMEGGKPGWNDAMNGLPGLVGSGMPETYEMLRLIKYVRVELQKYSRAVSLPTEFVTFLYEVSSALDTYNSQKTDVTTSGPADFEYWDTSNLAREKYRAAVVGTFGGSTSSVSAADLIKILTAFETKTQQGIDRALAMNSGLSPTYFYYECTGYEMLVPIATVPGFPPPATTVQVKSFKLHTLPLFLEGPTRHFKVTTDPTVRKTIYEKTKASNLYDSELKMYTLSESLKAMPQDVGRMMAFSAGWLENQSVWLHMSYKFYLELLRAGLYEEFYAEIKTGLVPFMDNKVYGRSPLEAASFIVSSAFPDPKLHGASFLARLSGSTAEFLSMWAIMMAGPNPFVLNSSTGSLELILSPKLPAWLFNDQGIVSFTFLGTVKVTYHNPNAKDTWNITPQSIIVTGLDGLLQTFQGGVITGTTAALVRSQHVSTIDVYF